MEERIALYGDNCIECPRYNAYGEAELKTLQNCDIRWVGDIGWCRMKKFFLE